MELTNYVTALAALAHESRLAVFRLLVEAGPEGLPAGAIGDRLEIAPTTLSFHLSQLSHAGLARSRRNGRSIIYSANFETMQDLMGFLTENCCKDSPQACVFPVPAAPQPRRSQRKSSP
jgi:DNA-binding transcriptional ArsR family regulator